MCAALCGSAGRTAGIFVCLVDHQPPRVPGGGYQPGRFCVVLSSDPSWFYAGVGRRTGQPYDASDRRFGFAHRAAGRLANRQIWAQRDGDSERDDRRRRGARYPVCDRH